MMRRGADHASQHGAEEERWAEDATCVARRIAGGDGEELEQQEQKHQVECHASVQRVADKAVTHAQHLGHKPSHRAHQQTARQRLEPDRPARQAQKPGTHPKQQPGEGRRDHSAGHAEHRIDGKLG